MSECSHDCSSCSQNCSSRQNPQDFHEAPHKLSSIKKVIGVVSGKGGVGKSMTSALMAVEMRRRGYGVGILDADITGPSIPKLFGIHGRAMGDENGIWPIESRMGIDVMSINLLLEHEEDPVVWRGPVIAGAVKQFWQDVIWKDVDFLFVDMPPGTGDVPLTVFQTLPVDGIIVVASPQELVSMILRGMPGLRQADQGIRRKPCGRGCRQVQHSRSGQVPHRPQAGRVCRPGPDRGVWRPVPECRS